MKAKTFLLGLIPLFFLGLKYMMERDLTTRPTVPNFDPVEAGFHGKSLKRYSFGFDNFMAGLIWINLLQRIQDQPVHTNEVSWEYAQIDGIIQLDPNFNQAYDFGSIYLSVFRRDKLGAKMIIESWVKKRPTYWRTHYLLGYHLYAEMGQYSQASKHILQAASLERAPAWLPSLGVRLLSETGKLVQSLSLSLQLYNTYEHPLARARLGMRIRSLNFKIQLSAWNDALKEFQQRHKKNPSSIEDLKPLMVEQFRELSSVVNAHQLADEPRKLIRENFNFHYDSSKNEVVSLMSMKELKLENEGIHVPQVLEDVHKKYKETQQ